MTSASTATDQTADPASGPKPASPGIEMLLVLGVSLGISAISSWINFLDIQTRGGFRHATATLNGAQNDRAWVDLSYQLLDVLNGKADTPAIEVGFAPGSKTEFSAGGYLVLQQLLMDITGKPFPELVKEHVFGPAGMPEGR